MSLAEQSPGGGFEEDIEFIEGFRVDFAEILLSYNIESGISGKRLSNGFLGMEDNHVFSVEVC